MAQSQQKSAGAKTLADELIAFFNFINEPPQYEDQRMVRDYRHELARHWAPLHDKITAALSAPAASTGEPVKAGAVLGLKPSLDRDLAERQIPQTFQDELRALRKLAALPAPKAAGPSCSDPNCKDQNCNYDNEPAPVAGEARSAVIEACARVADEYSHNTSRGRAWGAKAAAKAIRALSQAPATDATATREPQRWPTKGDLMKFIGKNGYPSELDEALKIFTVGNSYRVHDCDVGSFSHSVQFDGVKGRFNGVMFELVGVA